MFYFYDSLMHLFLEKKGCFTFREIMQFWFLSNVSISVQQNAKVLKRTFARITLNNYTFSGSACTRFTESKHQWFF